MDITALFTISYGVYIVSATNGKKHNAQIANTLFQINSEPPTLETVINKLNLTHEFLENSEYFGVAVLNTEVLMKYIGRFGFRSGRDSDKFEGIDYKLTPHGIAIPLEYTVSWMECKITKKFDVNTHTIFIGELTDAEVLSHEEPLTYAHYHLVKKGKEPATAPTFVRRDVSPKT